MAEVNPQSLADKLLASSFERNSPSVSALTDPIVDTPMVVTLDQLRPYDHDPRVKRNPAYEEIKASIRERGLDAAPAITRRPGAEHYIIRNGGNTRLAILRELWSETKDEQFFRISCLFRPWPERGEIITLTGHLAENELRGNLTFIERALGVERARELYEQETDKPLSQSELARRLNADGYPVPQPHISRMSDAVRYLLPAIPTVLYAGLGRHQVERLVIMRNMGEHVWKRYAKDRELTVDFEGFFQDVLAQFDAQGDEFSVPRVQDELVGEMSELFGVSYDMLTFELTEPDVRQHALRTALAVPLVPPTLPMPEPVVLTQPTSQPQVEISPPPELLRPTPTQQPATNPASARNDEPQDVLHQVPASQEDATATLLQDHIVSPAQTTERLQSIQKLIAEQLGEESPLDFARNVLQSIPVQAGGLYPISDVWYIDPGLDEPQRLRTHIAQFAREIAAEVSLSDCIEDRDDGIGFACHFHAQNLPASAQATLALLSVFAAQMSAGADELHSTLPILLHGQGDVSKRLSDTALVKLFRLIRLARRLFDLEASVTDNEG